MLRLTTLCVISYINSKLGKSIVPPLSKLSVDCIWVTCMQNFLSNWKE